MQLQTRIFDLARQLGWSDRQLAIRMGVSPSLVSRVRSGEYGINGTFITGAQLAFPDKSLDDLFYTEPKTEPVTDDSAAS